MGFSDVSTLLWRQREVLQDLLFKLTEEQLILSSGHTRWLARANDEVEQALHVLRGTDVLRAAEIGAIAKEYRLVGTPTLAELASMAPEPWAAIFTDHRNELLVLMADVQQVSDTARLLLNEGVRALHDTLSSFTNPLESDPLESDPIDSDILDGEGR